MFCIVPNITLSLNQIQDNEKSRTILYHSLYLAVDGRRLGIFGPLSRAGSKYSKSSLYQKVQQLDSQLFAAFNRRDTVVFAAMFSKELEFFHDKGGLTGYGETTGFLQSTIRNGSDLQRTLVPGTLEVYPIPGYGAIQTGTHEFCHTEQNKKDCGRFKFLHIWKQTGDQWQITRVVSYDH